MQRTPPPAPPSSLSRPHSASLGHHRGSVSSQQRHLLALLADASAAFVLSPHSADEDGDDTDALDGEMDNGQAEASDRSGVCSAKDSPRSQVVAPRRRVQSSDAGDEGETSDVSNGLVKIV